MKYKIELEIECGEETCASEPGKFCRWFGSKSFGRKPVCTLFNDPWSSESHVELFEEGGWTRRCPECQERGKYAQENGLFTSQSAGTDKQRQVGR